MGPTPRPTHRATTGMEEEGLRPEEATPPRRPPMAVGPTLPPTPALPLRMDLPMVTHRYT